MTRFRIVRDTLSVLALALGFSACAQADRCGWACESAASAPTSPPVVAAVGASAAPVAAANADEAAAKAVHNYKRLSRTLARGAVPEGDAAFAALGAAGIKTIVTVDGAVPDVATAKRHGIRYVHIPFGYDGIPESKALELAKTFEQLAPSGAIFVHCHHGKHRGPAGCAIASILLDGVTNEAAVADMKAAGTDPKYAGLYESIRTYKRPTAAELAAVKVDMPEVAAPGSSAAVMADIDHSWDRMKAVRMAKWSAPKDHADVDPSHEAVILAEGLREFGRRPEIASENEAFRTLLADAEASAWSMSKALEKGSFDAEKAEAAFTATQKSCAACHTQFRDNTHR